MHPVALCTFFIFVAICFTPVTVKGGQGPYSGKSSGSVIKISPSRATVGFGESVTFSATGGSSPITWKVSKKRFGTIDSLGIFTANKTRTKKKKLYVLATDAKGKRVRVRVRVIRNRIEVLPAVAAVEFGESLTFTATGGYKEKYTWTVNDKTYGFIDASSGVFTAKTSEGTVKVRARDYAGTKKTATVDVVETVLGVTPSVLTITKGDTYTFSASGGTGLYFWFLDDISLGEIGFESGEFTARLTEGTVYVTVQDDAGNAGTAVVTIVGSSIALTPFTVSITKGATQQFTATGASDTIYWSVSDRTIGTVDSDGLFTAKTTVGSVTITAKDSKENSGTATVSVEATFLDILPSSWSVASVATGSDLENSFTASGGSGTYFWSVSNNDASSSYTATLSDASGTTTTATVTIPTSDIGGQVLIILVQDTYGDSGTAKVSVEASTD